MNPIRHLWLDLEDTVITPVLTGWANSELINITKVRAFMTGFKPDHVHIFSFAIWNEKEKASFATHVQPMLEQALGDKLDWVPTVDDDILPACCKVMGLSPERVDFSEMSAFWSKHEAFRLFMRHMFRSGSTPVEVALLDDAVYNETFSWPNLNVNGRIINIDQLQSE